MTNDIYPGAVFHKWTVVNGEMIHTSYGKNKVLCKCECGTEREVAIQSLRNGTSKSCGCRQKKQFADARQIHIGKKFGRLTIIEYGDKEYSYKWKCQCECGNISYVALFDLQSGKRTSCGCITVDKKKSNMDEMIGVRFGKVTVTAIDDYEAGTVVYQCDCGNIKTTPYYNLNYGRIISCGCVKSKGELLVSRILKTHNIPFKQQVTFQDCRDKLPLPFDFGIYQNDKLLGLIEYNGDIHYSTRGTGWNTPDRLLKVQKHDYIKQKFCETKGIPFLVIPYSINNIENFFLTSDFYQIISKNFND